MSKASSQERQQRASPRIAATFKVRYESFAEFLTEYTEDLSRGGMFLVTRKFLPLNTVIQCVLYLPGTDEEVRIIGRVVHVLDGRSASAHGRKPGLGVEFLDVSREDADRLLGYLARITTAAAHAKPDARALELASATQLRKRPDADVLVVDDQAAYLEQIGLALGRAGFKVRKAENGLVGLAQCLKKPPDLILCDVNMPEMDGWTLLRIVRSRPTLAPIPFVFLTQLGGEAERLRGYKLGVDDYITKPHDLDALAGRLDRILARCEDAPTRAMDTKTLAGDLDQVSLSALLGYLDDEKKSGVLLLLRDQERAMLYLAEGRVIKVEVARADLRGADKVHYTLDWARGRFEFAAHDVLAVDEIGMSVRELLAEHERRAAAS